MRISKYSLSPISRSLGLAIALFGLACGEGAPPSAGAGDEADLDETSSALAGGQSAGRCRYRHANGQETYQDAFGQERICLPGDQNVWFGHCRDQESSTAEVACDPSPACPGDNEWRCENREAGWFYDARTWCCTFSSAQGTCSYRHPDGRVSAQDFFGHGRRCTPGDAGVWSVQCSDTRSETQEVGCAAASSSGARLNATCRYRHADGRINDRAWDGVSRACTVGASNWYSQCSDGQASTVEEGCACPDGYDWTTCGGSGVCLARGSSC